MNLDLIDKEQFIENFEGEFEGNDQKGYLYKGFFVSTSEIYDATCRMASDCGDLKELIEENNEVSAGAVDFLPKAGKLLIFPS